MVETRVEETGVAVTRSLVAAVEAVAAAEVVVAVVVTTDLMLLSTTAKGEESRVQKRVSWNEGHHTSAAGQYHQCQCNNRYIPMPPHMTRTGWMIGLAHDGRP